jgi:hypothetical protein
MENKHCTNCAFVSDNLDCKLPTPEEFERLVMAENPITMHRAILRAYWIFRGLIGKDICKNEVLPCQ